MRRRSFWIATAFVAPSCALSLFAACSHSSSLDVVLEDPSNARAKATTVELLVYQDACPAIDALSRGDEGTSLTRQVLAASNPPPALGDLARGAYGFAAVLRDGTCAVIASGCTSASLDDDKKVVIPLGAVTPSQGACASATACVAAACVSADGGISDAGDAGDGGDSGAGGGGGSTGCSLALIATGALPALAQPGGSVAGPGVVATATGFLIAFREGSIDATMTSASIVTIGDDGTLGTPSKQPIPTCAGFIADDGVGLAATNTGGLVAVTSPACGDAGAGLTLLPFNAKYALGAAVETASIGTNLRLAPAHALYASGTDYEAILVSQGVAYRATVDTMGGLTKAPLFASGTSSFAEIAAANGVMASFADHLPVGETDLTIGPYAPLVTPDGGAGGSGAGGGGAGGGAAAPPQSSFALHEPLSPWGGVAAWPVGGVVRAVAATLDSNGTTTYAAIDAKGVSRGSGTLGQPDAGSLTAADVVMLRDHVFVAVAQPRGFVVWKLSGAQGDALSLDGFGVDESNTVGDQNLGNYDGARISLAAARKRVLVTWVTRKQLGTLDPTGGYALFSCDQ